jgi:hypothetical protein
MAVEPTEPNPIRVTMILADYAQVADGKLNLVGGGWSYCGPNVAPFAVAMIIEVPWHLTNRQHHFKLELIDQDGNPVLAPPEDGPPVLMEADFEVGRPPGSQVGTAFPMPVAVNLSPPPPLPPGRRFEWRLEINGQTDEDWRLGFATRPQAQSEAA